MLKGFKDFIMQGNVVDLAVAVVIGTAFTAVINALVENVLMPLISALVGAPDFDSFAVVSLNGNDILFGVLLTQVVNFLLIAAAIYVVVVVPMNKIIEARKRRLGLDLEDAEDVEPDVQLLTEIRDLLQQQSAR
ncbi:large conductance mechanosensitive channel protein MscL [Nesterenkonia suensis]